MPNAKGKHYVGPRSRNKYIYLNYPLRCCFPRDLFPWANDLPTPRTLPHVHRHLEMVVVVQERNYRLLWHEPCRRNMPSGRQCKQLAMSCIFGKKRRWHLQPSCNCYFKWSASCRILVELLTWRSGCQVLVQLRPQKIHQLSHYAGASSDHPDEKHLRRWRCEW